MNRSQILDFIRDRIHHVWTELSEARRTYYTANTGPQIEYWQARYDHILTVARNHGLDV